MLFGLLQTVELRLRAVVAEGLALVEPGAADGADPGVLGAVRAVAGADDRPAAAGVGADAVRAALPVAESGGLLPAETGGKEQAAEQQRDHKFFHADPPSRARGRGENARRNPYPYSDPIINDFKIIAIK